ncbi:MAG: two-component system response regulator [Gemmatimonadales bacterium]|jgi:CheY-like chemotaxis protein
MVDPRILIIDDDKAIVAVMTAALTAGGFRVTVAFDAMQGFMFATKNPPDLILLDLSMPAGGGAQTWRRLQGSARTQGIPVVFVTAEARPGFEREVLSQGAVGYIAKPFDPTTLADQVQGFLARK